MLMCLLSSFFLVHLTYVLYPSLPPIFLLPSHDVFSRCLLFVWLFVCCFRTFTGNVCLYFFLPWYLLDVNFETARGFVLQRAWETNLNINAGVIHPTKGYMTHVPGRDTSAQVQMRIKQMVQDGYLCDPLRDCE